MNRICSGGSLVTVVFLSEQLKGVVPSFITVVLTGKVAIKVKLETNSEGSSTEVNEASSQVQHDSPLLIMSI